MATFRYLKYLTNYGNTIVAEQPTPFTLGPNEAQIFTNYEIPVIQPLYLYRENGGNILPNLDSNINAYLASIGQLPFENLFTGYTATTNTRLVGIESNITYLSGQTSQRLKTSDFNIYSGATLALIQSSQAGLDPKASVFVATTANLAGATYNAAGGSAASGQFTSAPTTIDGVTLSNGKRILVKNQTDSKQNGIYSVISSGTWNRSTDMDNSASGEVSAGNHTFVETGSTFTGTGWVVIGNGVLTLNTNPIIWTQFNAATAYSDGVGITITGMTISLNGSSIAGNALTWNGTQLNVNPTGGTLGTKFNTKLDVTSFNTFSGTTLPNTYTTKSKFFSYTGTTAPNTYQSKSSIVTLTGTTLPLTYQSKSSIVTLTGTTLPTTYVLKTVFSSFTGTTAPLTYQSKSSIIILTGTTLPATYVNKTQYNLFTGTTISSANNGLTESPNQTVRLGGSLTGNTTITTATGSRLNISGWPIQYSTDLSTNYNLRSLIDYGYFTGNTLHTSKQLLVYASGTTNISVTVPVALTLNRLIRNDVNTFTYSGGTKIKILSAGTYDVAYNINVVNSNGIAKSISSTILKNGSSLTETTASGSLAAATSAGCSLSLPPTQITLAANDIIQLTGFRLIVPLGGTADTTPNTVFLSLIKKY